MKSDNESRKEAVTLILTYCYGTHTWKVAAPYLSTLTQPPILYAYLTDTPIIMTKKVRVATFHALVYFDVDDPEISTY